MKLYNQQIIDAARRQRDLDTSSMKVKPWTTRRLHFQIPVWLVALPAAAIVGFFFGLFVHNPFFDETGQFMATVDTVYVTREVMVPQTPDTVVRYMERPKVTRTVKTVKPAVVTASVASAPITGRSIDQDDIDYTMLVKR
jgi:hypothetical protein